MTATRDRLPGRHARFIRSVTAPGRRGTTLAPGALLVALAFVGATLPRPAAGQGLYLGTAGTGDRFGAAVAGVGDLNGDGFHDFAIGDPTNDQDGVDQGRVYVYFGRGANLGTEADLSLTAGLGGDQFGYDVVGIGRFNGDEYDDLAVGAPFNDGGGADAGRVYVYFGGATMDDVPDLVLTGVQGGDRFGFSLAGGFDFNADGYHDLAVGAPYRSAIFQRAGEVRLFLGGPAPGTAAGFVVGGEQANESFGYDVSRAGHVNNDAFDDLVVGAPQPFELNPGRAYLLLGRSTAGTVLRLKLEGEFGTDRFGWAVAGGGDVNGDGYDDVVVGAPYVNAGNIDGGAVYLYLGGNPLNLERDARVTGRHSEDHLGWSVALDGDFNGDGRADLLAGAPDANDGGTDSGVLEIWYGGTPLLAAQSVTLPGPSLSPGFSAGDHFGASVAWVDYNGDGRSEALGGAPDGNLLSGEAAGLVSLNFAAGTLVPVALTDFVARRNPFSVELEWRTSGEPPVVGFHVDRSVAGSEAWRRVTDDLVPARADGSAAWRDDAPPLERLAYRITAITRDGGSGSFGPFTVAEPPPTDLALLPSMPNPLPRGGRARIGFATAAGGRARLDIFDTLGRRVRRLLDDEVGAGSSELSWEGTDDDGARLPAGLYFYRIEIDGRVATARLVLAR